jgi:hypothetical protein
MTGSDVRSTEQVADRWARRQLPAVRCAIWLAIPILAACGPGRRTGGVAASSPSLPDGGSPTGGGGVVPGDASDAGSPTAGGDPAPGDAGSPPDAGTTTQACVSAPDAGAPPALEVVPCPGTPPILWSRTFTDVEVDFRATADESGNLYWIEYDPAPTLQQPVAPAFLVSADSDGQNRYRIATGGTAVGAFALANGKVVLSESLSITAYDAATGSRAWSLDLTAPSPTGYDEIYDLTDLGNGRLAFVRTAGGYPADISLYIVDGTSGNVVWSAPFGSEPGIWGSDGAGSLFVTSNPSRSPPSYDLIQDIAVLDSSGAQMWKQQSAAASFLAWPPGMPLLSIAGIESFCSTANYRGAPGGWFGVTTGDDLGFAFSFGAGASTPDAVQVFRGDAALGAGPLSGTNGEDGFAAFPFVAGDHLDLVGQTWHGSPGLCHPETAGAAWFGRVDARSLYQCPLAFQGESGIEAAALLPGRLIVGRRTFLTDGCTHDVQPFTIEAYALPGESLARSGWVQRNGSPGLGRRPRNR